jgi:hypothetical protein
LNAAASFKFSRCVIKYVTNSLNLAVTSYNEGRGRGAKTRMKLRVFDTLYNPSIPR